MDSLAANVRAWIKKNDLLQPADTVLVALSGGADSVALLCVMLELQYRTFAVHLNHLLRGDESDRDEAFVRELCQARQVPCMVRRCDAAAVARKNGQSVETAARLMRYELFAQAAAQMGADKIATAHTADDNLETMLFHFARGTGPKGLAGIPPARDSIVRPLLGATRAQVEAYLCGLGQPYQTDSTNLTDEYTRNRLRHQAVPVLRGINPEIPLAALRLAGQLREENAYLDEQAESLLACAQRDGKYCCAVLRKAPQVLVSRALRLALQHADAPMGEITAEHIRAAVTLLGNPRPSARINLPGGFCLRREYDWLCVGRDAPIQNLTEIPLDLPFDRQLYPGGPRLIVKSREKKEVFYKSFNTFYADCGTIDCSTLVVRPRKVGDRLCLSTAGGSKTLKKLMIDHKIPRETREQMAVIADRKGVIAVQSLGIDISRRPIGGKILEIQFEGKQV